MAGFDVGTLLNQWADFGIFDYILPFLLIFAFVFGILTGVKIFSNNRGVNLTIALSIALLSLQFNYVPRFFSEVFPRFGVGIAVFIVLIMLTAVFIPEPHQKGWFIGFSIVGLLIGLVVVITSFNQFSFFDTSGWWYDYGGLIIFGVLLTVLIIFIAITPLKGDNEKAGNLSFNNPPFGRH